MVSSRGLGHGNVPVFKTPAELYRAVPEIGVVAVNTPPGVRHGIAHEALAAGKDVLLEKPPATTLSELADLEECAKAKGRVLFATWHSIFNPAVDEARALIAKAGVRSLQIEWREDVKKWHPGQDWVWEPGGFGVFDPGINALSILTHILPSIAFVKSADLTYPANRQTPIGVKLVFSDAKGTALTADFDWREKGDEKWHMMIELGGRSFCAPLQGRLRAQHRRQDRRRSAERGISAYLSPLRRAARNTPERRESGAAADRRRRDAARPPSDDGCVQW